MSRPRGRPVVVGIDGSEEGAAALRWAADEARRRRRSLRVVHIADSGQSTVGELIPELAAAARHAEQEMLDTAVTQARASAIDVDAVLEDGRVCTWLGPEIDVDALPSHEWEQAEKDEQARLAEDLQAWRSRFPDVDLIEKTVRGAPAATLIAESAGAKLLSVGSHGRGGFGGLVLGSVSHAVLHHAHCPVAVVRP
jgi:nucleotide-binding universal stress UspA family protein